MDKLRKAVKKVQLGRVVASEVLEDVEQRFAERRGTVGGGPVAALVKDSVGSKS